MIKNYYTDELGVVHQIDKKPFIKDYGEERNKYGETSHNLSYLRLGFIMASIPEIETYDSILDVGFGNGDFLRVCKNQFSIRGGYDLFYDYLPADCHKEESLMDSKYDIITFFDSLEHFDNERILDKLQCEYVVISVPNCIDPANDEWFTNWKHRRPDEHLHHFNEYSLSNLLQHQGYQIIKISYFEDIIRKSTEKNNILTVIAKK